MCRFLKGVIFRHQIALFMAIVLFMANMLAKLVLKKMIRVLFFQRIERPLILEMLVQNNLKQKLIQTINMQFVLLQIK